MEFIYVLLHGSEWEDITIFLSEEDAIHNSLKYPTSRVEVFSKTENPGYSPTYNYYKNGVYIQAS
jgi:hypothetical protein